MTTLTRALIRGVLASMNITEGEIPEQGAQPAGRFNWGVRPGGDKIFGWHGNLAHDEWVEFKGQRHYLLEGEVTRVESVPRKLSPYPIGKHLPFRLR
jgi:hypothetical protein